MLILFRWQHPGSFRQSGVLGTFFSLAHALPWKPATRPPKSRFGSLPPPATQGHHPKRDGRTYLVFAVAHHHHHMGMPQRHESVLLRGCKIPQSQMFISVFSRVKMLDWPCASIPSGPQLSWCWDCFSAAFPPSWKLSSCTAWQRLESHRRSLLHSGSRWSTRRWNRTMFYF